MEDDLNDVSDSAGVLANGLLLVEHLRPDKGKVVFDVQHLELGVQFRTRRGNVLTRVTPKEITLVGKVEKEETVGNVTFVTADTVTIRFCPEESTSEVLGEMGKGQFASTGKGNHFNSIAPMSMPDETVNVRSRSRSHTGAVHSRFKNSRSAALLVAPPSLKPPPKLKVKEAPAPAPAAPPPPGSSGLFSMDAASLAGVVAEDPALSTGPNDDADTPATIVGEVGLDDLISNNIDGAATIISTINASKSAPSSIASSPVAALGRKGQSAGAPAMTIPSAISPRTSTTASTTASTTTTFLPPPPSPPPASSS
eukprot:TRINITY_DN3618_c0_g1_i3.p1 TRINITY_DN3618_c0_g1~~TRINITY_DN3618_c0_g1_i3.p1  ORF type:complete len:311 (-),score=78.05 TRINITY_DN3618_c0_g1_i3:136-1068(-)